MANQILLPQMESSFPQTMFRNHFSQDYIHSPFSPNSSATQWNIPTPSFLNTSFSVQGTKRKMEDMDTSSSYSEAGHLRPIKRIDRKEKSGTPANSNIPIVLPPTPVSQPSQEIEQPRVVELEDEEILSDSANSQIVQEPADQSLESSSSVSSEEFPAKSSGQELVLYKQPKSFQFSPQFASKAKIWQSLMNNDELLKKVQQEIISHPEETSQKLFTCTNAISYESESEDEPRIREITEAEEKEILKEQEQKKVQQLESELESMDLS